MTAKFVELFQLGEFSHFEKNVRYKKYFTLSCRLDSFILYCIHWIRPRLTRKVTRGHNFNRSAILTGRRCRLLIPVLKTSLKNMRYRDHELRIRSDTLIYFIITNARGTLNPQGVSLVPFICMFIQHRDTKAHFYGLGLIRGIYAEYSSFVTWCTHKVTHATKLLYHRLKPNFD